jgi:hypothetical protein
MTGSWTVDVNAVRPFTIHGDLYWELHVKKFDGPPEELLLRVPQHAARVEPAPGQRVSVTFLMGQVTSVQLI